MLDAIIDLSDEKLDISLVKYTKDVNELGFKKGDKFSIAAYSLNGGSKWTVGELTEAKFKKALNKAMTLCVTDSYDKKAKKVTGNLIKFPKINARPKANPEKGRPWYESIWGETIWKFKSKTGAELNLVYEYLPLADDKKTPATHWQTGKPCTWEVFDQTFGEWVEEPIDKNGNKVKKTTYLFRLPPVNDGDNIVPASKTWKVTPALLGKAPKFKIDYKKEIIKGKAGAIFSDFGFEETSLEEIEKVMEGMEGITNISGTTFEEFIDIYEGNTYTYLQLVSTDKAIGASWFIDNLTDRSYPPKVTKESDGYERHEGSWLWISMKPTGKKPGTMWQALPVQPRATAVTSGDGGLSFDKMKVKGDLKLYQFLLDDENETWGKLPKITETSIFRVRKVPTAKGKANETDVFAAGELSHVMIIVGKEDEDSPSKITGIVFSLDKPIIPGGG